MDERERDDAARLLRDTPWVRALLAPAGLLDDDPPVWDGMFRLDSELRPKHYVAGTRAPLSAHPFLCI